MGEIPICFFFQGYIDSPLGTILNFMNSLRRSAFFLRAELFECRSAYSQNSPLLRGELFECGEMSNNNTSNLSHRRPPFLNPLGRGEARVFARSDSGFPSCYAWFRNGVPPRRDSGFEGRADTRTKPNKNRLD
jgi:hypothetical protein